jgi:type III secretion system FlhB-like substrate exporter
MYYQPKVVYQDINQPRKDSIIRYIGNRVLTTNKNFLCAVTGQTGSGKSWATVSICEKYAKMHNISFNPDKHIITSLMELLLLINSPERIRYALLELFCCLTSHKLRLMHDNGKRKLIKL